MITSLVLGAREIATTKDHRSRIEAVSETTAKRGNGIASATEEGAKIETGTGAAVSDPVAITAIPIGSEVVGKIKTPNNVSEQSTTVVCAIRYAFITSSS